MKPLEMFLKNTNIPQEWLGKTSAVSTNVEKRLQFANEHVSLPPKYWDDVISLGDSKIMLCYHNGSQKVWCKPLTAVENKNLIPTAKFGKLSVMVWGCISNKGVDVIRILNEIMAKEVYLDILKNELIASIKKFGFIDPVNSNKFCYKYYQDNDTYIHNWPLQRFSQNYIPSSSH